MAKNEDGQGKSASKSSFDIGTVLGFAFWRKDA